MMNQLEIMIAYDIPVLSEKQTPEQKKLLEKYSDRLPPELEKKVKEEVALAHRHLKPYESPQATIIRNKSAESFYN